MGCNLYAPFFRVIFIDGVGASGLFPSWVVGVGFSGGGVLYPPLFLRYLEKSSSQSVRIFWLANSLAT